MSTDVLGSQNYLTTPTVNGVNLLLDTGNLNTLRTYSSNGVLVFTGSTFVSRNIIGTTDEIDVTNADGVSGNITVSISDNPVLPGTATLTLPQGTTAERVTSTGGIRFNTTRQVFEGYTGTAWTDLSILSGQLSAKRIWAGNIGSFTTTGNISTGSTPSMSTGVSVFSLTITPPTTTSKYIIQISLSVINTSGSKTYCIALFRGSTLLTVQSPSSNNAIFRDVIPLNFYDAPATTSSITYSVRVAATNGITTINDTVFRTVNQSSYSVWEVE